jgi:hypothetical protein
MELNPDIHIFMHSILSLETRCDNLLASDFLRGLLYFYGIQIHHLNLNSIAHVAIFYIFVKLFWGSSPTLLCFVISSA